VKPTNKAPAATGESCKAENAGGGAGTRPARKRRFPYRKIEELEADVAGWETRLRELEKRLALPDFDRDGGRVKKTMKGVDEAKAALRQLYEHWEEAAELN